MRRACTLFCAALANTPEVMQELREIAGFRRLSIYYIYQTYFMRVLLGAIRLLRKDLFSFHIFTKKLFPPPSQSEKDTVQ